jgi:hypothetical protein
MGTQQAWRLNSLFDPNLTGTGHQPYGFDQLAALYQRYLVYAVTFDLKFVNPSAASVLCAARIIPMGITSSMTGETTNSVSERPDSVTRPLSVNGEEVAHIRASINLWEVNGIPKAQYMATEDYGALGNANPAEVTLLEASAGSLTATADITVEAQLNITFYARFWQRVPLAAS